MKKHNGQKSLWLAAWRLSRLPILWPGPGPKRYGDPARAVTTRRHLELAEKQRWATKSDPLRQPAWWKHPVWQHQVARRRLLALVKDQKAKDRKSPPLPLP